MKIRNKLVSNSSSTCFILDLKDDGVPEIVEKVISYGIHSPCDLGRLSAIAVGHEAIDYARYLDGYDYVGTKSLADWILSHTSTINKDNLVFIRSSDEGMGGWVPDLRRIHELAKSDKEYH